MADRTNEFIIKDPHIRTEESKEEPKVEEITNALRFYKTSPCGFTLQLRTYGQTMPAYQHSKAKPKHMISSISLSFEEIEKLYNFAKEKKD